MDSKTVRELRESIGLSQTLFGEKLGVSLRTVQNWEGGHRAVPETASILIQMLFENDIIKLGGDAAARLLSGDFLRSKSSGIAAPDVEQISAEQYTESSTRYKYALSLIEAMDGEEDHKNELAKILKSIMEENAKFRKLAQQLSSVVGNL